MTPDRQPMVSQNKKILILVIDDDIQILDLIEKIVKETEFGVLRASDGREGIKIAQKHNPSIILLDIFMPKYDGFMTCGALKRNVNTKNIPVIFMTGTKLKDHILKAIKAGASDYIVKPFKPSELLTRLRKIMDCEESLRLRDSKEKERIKADLKILIVNDTPTMRKIIINIVKKAGYSDVKEADNGRDALALIMAGDFNFIITGWDMPFMNGIELTIAIRSDERLKDLPILMVTSRDENYNKLDAKNAGVNDYIATISDISELKDKIPKVLRRFSQQK